MGQRLYAGAEAAMAAKHDFFGRFFNRESVGSASSVERTEDDDKSPLSKLLHQTILGDHSQ